jgi:CRP/FNR family transcriptional regulator, cyclic AMP receptor protein
VLEDPMQTTYGTDLDDYSNASKSRGLIERLSSEAQAEFELLKVSFNCPANTILFIEEQAPSNILFLLAGQVKLYMNSSAGRRLILGIADPGETLGLASALSGSRYDITAETLSPCSIAAVNREDLIGFLTRNPSAYKKVVQELCLDCARACEQVRTIGLATVPARLARLLLEWCADGLKTEHGTRLFCSLTHGEIGECIGASRETVTRILSEFRYQELLESRGSTLIISNQRALEIFAGIGRVSP